MKKNTEPKPQQFNYLGKKFTPLFARKEDDFIKISGKLWGSSNKDAPCMYKLFELNQYYKHEDFYKAAANAGCGGIDVFEMDGEKVIPCHIMRYYGKPSWYSK